MKLKLEKEYLPIIHIESRIHHIRGCKVMLDRDLAELYGVKTKVLNQSVQRNEDRFPPDFMFYLTESEYRNLLKTNGDSKVSYGGRRYLPIVFTEYGIAMLSSVLKSERAIQVNIAIMRTFGKLREILSTNKELEKKLIELESKYDGQFKIVFDAIRELVSSQSVPRKRIVGLSKK